MMKGRKHKKRNMQEEENNKNKKTINKKKTHSRKTKHVKKRELGRTIKNRGTKTKQQTQPKRT